MKNPDFEKKEVQTLKQISKRKVLYIELDEEITSVYDRIKQLKMDDVYLVVPRRAVLLQSVVNLKILKRKNEELGKQIAIITNDPIGIKLVHQAGLTVYEKIEEKKKPKKEMVLTPEVKITPLDATTNPIEEEEPRRLAAKKISILEIVKKVREKKKKLSFNLLRSFFQDFKKRKKLAKEKGRFTLGLPSRRMLTTLIVASLGVLLVISYIALPGATIYLSPKSSVLEQSVNIILADYVKNAGELATHPPHLIASYPIETSFTKTIAYSSTGTLFRGENARGEVTLINEKNYEWPLVPRTRLQTEDGIVFRTQKFVTVPKATDAGLGKITVEVIADELDIYDRVVGDRGNIGPTRFFLPALRLESQKVLYGENTAPMTGGKTIVIKKVSAEDLEAAKNRLVSELQNAVRSELEKVVADLNAQNQTNLSLLTGEGTIEMSEPKISVPYELEDEEREQFDISGGISASGVAFNYQEFVNILKDELKTRKSPEKKLIKIDESSLTYRIFEKDKKGGRIKLTATIKGIEQYDLDPDQENGARLIKKIKEHIAGKSIREAKDYIQNLSEIDKVEIKSWPVWAPTIPTIPENIKIKVAEEDLTEGTEET